MSLAVVTTIANANRLEYPIQAVLESVAPITDEFVVNIGLPDIDGTYDLVASTLAKYPHIHKKILREEWNWNNREGGSELAIQTNKALAECGADWILYLQADEGIHENYHASIRTLIGNVYPSVTAFSLQRLYFWGNPNVIRADWTHWLTRLFRRGTRMAAGDAMDAIGDKPVISTNIPLYHYSRFGSPTKIAQRIATLDSLFHPKETIQPPDEYEFISRDFDSYSSEASPKIVSGKFVRYTGSHPKPFESWYRERGYWEPEYQGCCPGR